jgi:hypothetical protein
MAHKMHKLVPKDGVFCLCFSSLSKQNTVHKKSWMQYQDTNKVMGEPQYKSNQQHSQMMKPSRLADH